MDENPSNYHWVPPLWTFVISSVGGIVGYMDKKKNDKDKSWHIKEFICELITSGFVGMLTFYVCDYTCLPPSITAFLIGVNGHMGSRSIFLLKRYVEKKLMKVFWTEDDAQNK